MSNLHRRAVSTLHSKLLTARRQVEGARAGAPALDVIIAQAMPEWRHSWKYNESGQRKVSNYWWRKVDGRWRRRRLPAYSREVMTALAIAAGIPATRMVQTDGRRVLKRTDWQLLRLAIERDQEDCYTCSLLGGIDLAVGMHKDPVLAVVLAALAARIQHIGAEIDG